MDKKEEFLTIFRELEEEIVKMMKVMFLLIVH